MIESENSDLINRSRSPRVRLVNGWSIIIFLLSSVAALWLVAPSRDMLINLIASSSATEVSLAFLEALNKNQEMSPDVLMLMSKKHLELGHVDKADQIVQSLVLQQTTEIDWDVYKLNLDILLIKMHQQEGQEKDQSLDDVRSFLKDVRAIPDPGMAREFADSAISVSMPSVAYRYLYPHVGKADITEQELSKLALHNSNYSGAFKHQLKLFIEEENLEELNNLIALKVMSGKFDREMGIFFDRYSGELIENPEYLALSVSSAISLGNRERAIAKIDRLIKLTNDNKILSKVSDVAIENSMFDIAQKLLLAQIVNSPDQKIIKKLHDIYLWQDEVGKALEMSQKLISQEGTETQIRQALSETRGIADLHSEGLLYSKLAGQSKINVDEYNQWIDITEKSLGTSVAYAQVEKLLIKYPNDSSLVGHLARLQSYKGENQKVADSWQILKKLRKINRKEAIMFSSAYIHLQKPDLALDVLLSVEDWLDSDQKYLQSIFGLAWQFGRKEVAKKVQNKLRKFAGIDTASYENIYRFIQLYGPFEYKDIDRLVTLYQKWGSEKLLLLAIELAEREKELDKMAELLSLANKDERLDSNQIIMLYNLRLAMAQNDTILVKELFTKMIKINPNFDPAINAYIWWLIENDQLSELDHIYRIYRKPLKENSDFWLAFAATTEKLGYLDDLDYWYRQLIKKIALTKSQNDKNNPFSDDENVAGLLLNYASLLSMKGKTDVAFRLRKYVASMLATNLLNSDAGEVSYHSLVELFAGKSKSKTLIEKHTLDKPSKNKVVQFFSSFLAGGRVDNFIFWKQRSEFSKVKLPDWQMISVALQTNDKAAMSKLILESLTLPVADKHVALQKLGRHKEAWQHGQEKLGRMQNKIDENQLRRVHVNQHPMNARGLGIYYEAITIWDIDRVTARYVQPIKNGHLKIEATHQQTDAPEILLGQSVDDENRLRVTYRHQLQDSQWSIRLDVADGIGDQRFGMFADYIFNLDRYWQVRFGAGLNDAYESSQLLTLAGEDNHLLANITYSPTTREEFTLRFNVHDLSNRFGDDIGHGWDMTIRASEKLFFADPAWQLYSEYTIQRYKLESRPLYGISSAFDLTDPLLSSSFISEKYSRLSIGQRLSHGLVGVEGATVPSPRYWLDTSIGYNNISKMFDFTLSSGLGWRILGNDELYLAIDWQSQDLNGDKSVKVQFGYNVIW